MIAAGSVPKIIVEDAGLAVTERNFDQGESPDHGRILLLHDYSRTPFGVAVVYNPVSYFQVQLPSLFHTCYISKFYLTGK